MTTQNREANLLSKRMLAVANMVTGGNRVADIGCDHGFVSIYLVEQHIAPSVIAMDVNDGPLLRAKEHVEAHGLETYISVRKSDGAEQLLWTHKGQRTEVDTVIIAGMGGRLINKILLNSLDKLQTVSELILQPQSELFLVRRCLEDHHFKIVQEDMLCEEGKYYQIIKAVPDRESDSKMSEAEITFGPVLLQSKNHMLYQYLIREADKYQDILSKIQENSEQSGQDGGTGIRQKLLLIEEALRSF